jgi:hypothetical protein
MNADVLPPDQGMVRSKAGRPRERVMGKSKGPISFRRLLADLRRTFGDAFGGYHPERHYMRGPGPKWRERHGIPERGTPPWQLAPGPVEFVPVRTRSKRR